MSSQPAALNIVLVQPEIPQNAGNVGRTCLALGARLHLVGPMGFSLDEKSVRRAGLDYWAHVDLVLHDNWAAFAALLPAGASLAFLSRRGTRAFWDAPVATPQFLIFGSESRGLPSALYERYAESLFRVPMTDAVRSLNLATTVGIAAYDAARRLKLLAT